MRTHPWTALGLLCCAYFIVILDVAIVGVAAPSIKADLDFSQQGLQWIVSAYAITFGGLLLLGGRAADLLGRRRVFLAGTVLFTLASLAAGLAWSAEALIGARIVQGVGAAVITPAALSIIATIFGEGADRNKALGIWNAIGAVGGTTGLLLGGVLTDSVGWEWLFFLNVPIGSAVIAAAPLVLPESRADPATRRFDGAGALSVTAGLVLLVFGLVEAPDVGWGSAQTAVALIGAVGLLGLFVAIERISKAPLLPLRLLCVRSVAAGNLLGMLAGASVFSWFYIATLYLQQVLGYSPLEAGLAFLAGSLGGLVGSGIAQGLVTKLGLRPVALLGAGFVVAGLLLQTRVAVEGTYAADLLPAFVLMGIGTGFGFVASAIAALGGVEERQAGLASGLINTAQQIGGAIGVAILSTVAVSRTADSSPMALTEGFQAAFGAAAAFPIAAALVALVLIRRARVAEPRTEPARP